MAGRKPHCDLRPPSLQAARHFPRLHAGSGSDVDGRVRHRAVAGVGLSALGCVARSRMAERLGTASPPGREAGLTSQDCDGPGVAAQRLGAVRPPGMEAGLTSQGCGGPEAAAQRLGTVRPPGMEAGLTSQGCGGPEGTAAVKLEAAGVEPASRDVSEQTSTCVSGQFGSRPRVPGRQGASLASPERFWPRPYQAMKRGEPDLATAWEALPAGAIARGCLIKQPERTELRQLKHGRLFTWPADQPRHAI
jgi:hypothetical protein